MLIEKNSGVYSSQYLSGFIPVKLQHAYRNVKRVKKFNEYVFNADNYEGCVGLIGYCS